ncbi:phage shock protein C [Geomicrobium halophilum]|uniref:Phage shock protein C n=1 Tax=Geomicrobium halophilum TaxID=549000 RepID=A0A841PNL7_9BACL|nr:PspC domain-containing protein [Geomicrobium halophilum]MBB6450349.1 phage shock protein C [Geomicrobium halophilum]
MKHLVRSENNRMITGVCGGIGKHLNINPIIIRVIAVIGLFVGLPVTVLIYLALTVLVPSEGAS